MRGGASMTKNKLNNVWTWNGLKHVCQPCGQGELHRKITKHGRQTSTYRYFCGQICFLRMFTLKLLPFVIRGSIFLDQPVLEASFDSISKCTHYIYKNNLSKSLRSARFIPNSEKCCTSLANCEILDWSRTKNIRFATKTKRTINS